MFIIKSSVEIAQDCMPGHLTYKPPPGGKFACLGPREKIMTGPTFQLSDWEHITKRPHRDCGGMSVTVMVKEGGHSHGWWGEQWELGRRGRGEKGGRRGDPTARRRRAGNKWVRSGLGLGLGVG